ncbi:MAG: translation elongation factor Ts [Fidelibacterota bacterium]
MAIDAMKVKALRERTGAGIMDCKEALVATDGNMDRAVEVLRKRGIAKADKKLGRRADQGVAISYVHPGNRIGVLVEVNCETDFVAKTDDFLRFARDMAMQIAATNPLAVSRDAIDSDVIDREREIYKEQALSMGNKPDTIIEKIVNGKVEKFYQENCLLEQPFIKDHEKSVQDVLTETIASLGENITIARFARFEVGENSSPDGEA